jgi:hypothetical protein
MKNYLSFSIFFAEHYVVSSLKLFKLTQKSKRIRILFLQMFLHSKPQDRIRIQYVCWIQIRILKRQLEYQRTPTTPRTSEPVDTSLPKAVFSTSTPERTTATAGQRTAQVQLEHQGMPTTAGPSEPGKK